MKTAPPSLGALLAHGFDTLIDVRSPSEYAEDHIPGAINLPVLSDEERARVGTIYVQQSAFTARKIGAALVARNAASHIETTLAGHDGGWRPLVYCWRGGQRSGSFASILAQIGWRAETLEGGYRSYRRMVVNRLYEAAVPFNLLVLDGFTGTAKTDILKQAGKDGAQVLDLEGMAGHRGSVLGAMSGPQPSQKGFETALALAFEALDPTEPVLVEAESSKIGEIILPPMLWKAMRAAPRLRIAASMDARASYLVRAYEDLAIDPERLRDLLERLVPFHGRERVAGWQSMAGEGDLEPLARVLIERHYDPRYARSQGRFEDRVLDTIVAPDLGRGGIEATARRVVEALSSLRSRPDDP